jgi:hypothetical protein
MTSNPAQKKESAKKRVRFFNVSLRNGIVVSTPAYPEKQAFLGHVIRALESSNPDFAWIQFLFVSSGYSSALVRLKNSMHRAKASIEQPTIDLISGEERGRRELHHDYYRRSDARMKKVDDIATKPTVTLAIQGMWVCDKGASSPNSLPFEDAPRTGRQEDGRGHRRVLRPLHQVEDGAAVVPRHPGGAGVVHPSAGR